MSETTIQQVQDQISKLSERMVKIETEETVQNREIRDLKNASDKQTGILLELKEINHNIAMNTEQTKNLAMQIKEQGDEIKKQADRIDDVEKKPAKRWDQAVTSIITTVVGGIVGAILALVIKK